MNALRERTDAPHAERIRDLLTAAGIDVVTVNPVLANRSVFNVDVRPLSDRALTAVLPALRKSMAQDGYGISWTTLMTCATDRIRVEVLP